MDWDWVLTLGLLVAVLLAFVGFFFQGRKWSNVYGTKTPDEEPVSKPEAGKPKPSSPTEVHKAEEAPEALAERERLEQEYADLQSRQDTDRARINELRGIINERRQRAGLPPLETSPATTPGSPTGQTRRRNQQK